MRTLFSTYESRGNGETTLELARLAFGAVARVGKSQDLTEQVVGIGVWLARIGIRR